jgi:hypothetical protein
MSETKFTPLSSESLIEVSLISGFDFYCHIVQGWQKVFSIDSADGLTTIIEKYADLPNIADRRNKDSIRI